MESGETFKRSARPDAENPLSLMAQAQHLACDWLSSGLGADFHGANGCCG